MQEFQNAMKEFTDRMCQLIATIVPKRMQWTENLK